MDEDTNGHTDGAAAEPPQEDAQALTVVGIGASAGGIEALQAFFENTPPDSRLAFVVVQHLSPEHESRLAEVLGQVTALPVRQVTEPIHLEPNHIYVIPPSRYLVAEDGVVSPVEMDTPRGQRIAIDRFFRTLAEVHAPEAVAIIMSGTGADGSLGLKQIKEGGGLVIAQEPEEAAYDAMPRNAIATGLVDFVLPAADMPAQIIAYRDATLRMLLPGEAAPSTEQQDERPEAEAALQGILAHLRSQTGHDFAVYKRATVLRRIGRRLQVNDLPDLPTYLRFLHSHPSEGQELLKDLLISVTQFFRDPEAWEALEREVIPRLFEGRGPDDEVRAWVCGCATGEEAYSLAILLLEQAARLERPPRVQVFATDMASDAITYARDASYPETIVGDISPERLRGWFIRDNGRYRVRKELRETVLFALHDVLRDTPFSRLDLVTCRNLLIYLTAPAQTRIFEIFHFGLRTDGRLLLGSSESVDGSSALFGVADKPNRLYLRRSVPRTVPVFPSTPRPLNLPARAALPSDTAPISSPDSEQAAAPTASLLPATGEVHLKLLELYAPPSVLVGEDYQILHLSGGAGRFLRFPGGSLTSDLMRVLHPDLRLDVSTALYAAESSRQVQVRRALVALNERGPSVPVRVTVRSVQEPEDADGFYLVLFEEESPEQAAAAPTAAEADAADAQADVVRAMEAEIARLRFRLRSTIDQYEASSEELKASNEELQAVNEEMRSATEELETGREELQSVNEELNTVNQELKNRVEEVSRSNADMHNLLVSTDIATIFVDRELRIKRYTPTAETLFNIIPTDVGRPLAHLTHRLEYNNLTEDAEGVILRLATLEREVLSTDGRYLLARLSPYRTQDDRISGVVVTFVDITERKQAEEVLRENDVRQAFLLRLADALRPLTDPTEIQGEATRLLAGHMGVDRAYYVEVDEAAGVASVAQDFVRDGTPSLSGKHRIADFGWSVKILRRGECHVIADTRTSPLVPPKDRPASAALQIIACMGAPLIKAERLVGALCVAQGQPRAWRDSEVELLREVGERLWAATERARAEEALRASQERLRLALDAAQFGTFLYHFAEDRGEPDARMQALFGLPAGGTLNLAAALADMIYPDDRENYAAAVRRAADPAGSGFLNEEIRVVHPDRSLHWVVVTGQAVFEGEPPRAAMMYGVAADITERKQADEALRDSEERQVFLLKLSDAIRSLKNPLEIQQVASRLLGEHLNATRAFYFFTEPADDGDWIHIIETDYLRDPALRSHAGRHSVRDFGLGLFAGAERGRVVAIEDVTEVPTLTPSEIEKYLAVDVRAFINVPLIKDGRFVAGIGAHDSSARVWKPSEIALIQEVAERVWVAVERARAEQALRESEDRARALIGNLPGGAVFVVNRDERYVLAEGEALAAVGFTPADFLGKTLDEALPSEMVPSYRRLYGQALAGEPFEEEHFSHGRWFLTRGVPLRGDGIVGALAVSYDITTRRQIEEALRTSEERFRLLAAGAKDYAIFLLDPELRITFWSAGAEHVFGWSAEEVQGQYADIVFTPEDRAQGRLEQETSLARAEGSALDRRWHVRKDGSVIWADGVLIRLGSDAEEAQGFAKIARNATQEREAENALRQARDELEARVTERTETLSEALTSLESALSERRQAEEERQKLLGQLVLAQEAERGRISREMHDQMGQHLTGLLLGLKTLESSLTPATPAADLAARLQETAAMISTEMHQMARDLRPPALDDLGLEATLRNYTQEWGERYGIAADFHSRNFEGFRLQPDAETALYRIVQEALTNVARHARADRADVLLERHDDEALLIVENNGPGFDVEQVLSQPQRLGIGGMRERATLVGGTLNIESEPERGTTVFVRIPLRPEETPDA